MHRAGHWASTHLVLNAMNMHTSVHLSLLPTPMYDPAKGIVLTSDFEARALSMPAGTGPHSLIHAIIKKFGHNMVVTANDLAQELIDAARIIEDILDNAKASRAKKAVDNRLKYHMGATFLTKKLRMTIGALAPIGTLGSYLVNCQKSSTLTHSPLIRRKVDGKMTKVYVNAEGYNEAYQKLCAALNRTISANALNAINALSGSATSGLMMFDQFKKLAALTVIPEKDWEAQYAEMEAAYEAIKVASYKTDAVSASSSNARSAPGTAKE
jgi:hypothetical protein